MGKFAPTSTTEWGNTSTTEWFGNSTSLSCNEVISFGTISYKNRTVGTFCAESFSLTGPVTKAVTINRLIEALAQISDEGTFNLTRMLGLNTGFNIASTISLLQTKLLELNESFTFSDTSDWLTTVRLFLEETLSLSDASEALRLIALLLSSNISIDSSTYSLIKRNKTITENISIDQLVEYLQTKVLTLEENISFSNISDWLSSVSLLLEEVIGISATSDAMRFLSLILTASLNFDSSNTRQITFHQTLPEHISITDLITIIKTIALTCEEVINLSGVGFYVDVEGKVTITFQLKKGTVSFTLK